MNNNNNTQQQLQMLIDKPTDYDILCGKDKSFSKHKGNQMFRDKIMSMTDEYRNASGKPDRMKLTKIIVDTLKLQHHARFLRLVSEEDDDNNSNDGIQLWEEITDQQARDKTSHALRFALTKEEKRASSSIKAISKVKRRYRRRASIGSCPKTAASTDVSRAPRMKKHVRKCHPPIVGMMLSSSDTNNYTKNKEMGDELELYETLSNRTDHSYDESVATEFSTDTSGVDSTDTDAVSTTFSLAEEDTDSITCLFLDDRLSEFDIESRSYSNRVHNDDQLRLVQSDHHYQYYNRSYSSDVNSYTHYEDFSSWQYQQGYHSSPSRLGGENNRMENTIFSFYQDNDDSFAHDIVSSGYQGNVEFLGDESRSPQNTYYHHHHYGTAAANQHQHGNNNNRIHDNDEVNNNELSIDDLNFFDEDIKKDWDDMDYSNNNRNDNDNDETQQDIVASSSYYFNSGTNSDPHGLYEL